MTRVIFFVMMIASLSAVAQNFQAFKDVENGALVLKGPLNMEHLRTQESFRWFAQNAAYAPNDSIVKQLKGKLSQYDMVVVMGTWCEDSQTLIPKLYTVLQQSDYPMRKLHMFGVDRTKDALNGEKAKYNIEKVPTIILFDGEKEIGRITETVQQSMEADLVLLLKTQGKL